MDDELTPEQKFAAEDPSTMVPRALLKGRDPEDIVRELVRHDWRPDVARELVAQAAEDLRRHRESPEGRRELVREARVQVVAGLLLTLGGLVFTGLSIFANIVGGLPFIVIATGVVCAGIVMATRGWSRWRVFRHDTLRL